MSRYFTFSIHTKQTKQPTEKKFVLKLYLLKITWTNIIQFEANLTQGLNKTKSRFQNYTGYLIYYIAMGWVILWESTLKYLQAYIQ